MEVLDRRALEAPVEGLEVAAYTVPTEEPESDGTLQWDSTTCVVVHARAAGATGLGYTYGPASIAHYVSSKLAGIVTGVEALNPQAAWAAMQAAIRNDGRQGQGAMAVSAVDVALWDLKARLLGVSLADLLGRFRPATPIYASAGFTSWSDEHLAAWAQAAPAPRIKIKVGREPQHDPARLAAVRGAAGDGTELMVDANGAFTPKQALAHAQRYADFGVTYFEEPVSSDDRAGLRLVRERAPAGMGIAAGEYEWDLHSLGQLAPCVDVLQADVTRCGGITNVLRVDGICKARALPFSAHCAPAISAHVCCALECTQHLEWFHDHVRLESMLFDGAPEPRDGALWPDSARPGLGLELKRADAARWEAG